MLEIGGFQPQSLIDYPGHISAVIFTIGCNFRCPYCHNSELVLSEYYAKPLDIEKIFSYLNKYKRLLDAVCITGGEPTIHKTLPDLINKIKNLGLKVKLDTNGTKPEMIEFLVKENLVDAFAMDIKHLLNKEKYATAIGYDIKQKQLDKINKSIEIIRSSDIPCNFRTTVVRGIHKVEDIALIQRQFSPNHQVQNFKSGKTLNPEVKMAPFDTVELQEMKHNTLNVATKDRAIFSLK